MMEPSNLKKADGAQICLLKSHLFLSTCEVMMHTNLRADNVENIRLKLQIQRSFSIRSIFSF